MKPTTPPLPANHMNTKITHLCFTLSMPNRGSWNGRWSGENRGYFVIRKVLANRKSQERAQKILAQKILAQKSYYYRWSDGWGAGVGVRPVDGKEARQLKRRSEGFCGYDWMIDSIYEHGAIYASNDEIPKQEPEVTPAEIHADTQALKEAAQIQ